MNDELHRAIATKSGVELRPATEGDLRELRNLNAPEDAIAFYREAEPTRCAEIKRIRLWPITKVVEENTDYIPGCYVQQYGYVVFSTTIYGDTYCFDLNSATSTASAPIVLLSHEVIDETTTEEQVRAMAKAIAPDLQTFLTAFVAGTLDMTPNF
jgi:hypothetical protein